VPADDPNWLLILQYITNESIKRIGSDLNSFSINNPYSWFSSKQIDINEDQIVFNKKYRTELTYKILHRHYHFNPKYYIEDKKRKIYYTKDYSIILKFSPKLVFVKVDFNIVKYIMSLAILVKLELIQSEDFYTILELVCKFINLKFRIERSLRRSVLTRYISGKAVEQLVITIYDENVKAEMEYSDYRLSIKGAVVPRKEFDDSG
jgi:hypothetical protein